MRVRLNKRQFTLIGLILIALAIPITLVVVNRRQQYRGEAAIYPSGDCRKNVDVVLVLDISSSMRTVSGGTNQTALDVAKAATNDFLDALEFTDGDHNEGIKDGLIDSVGIITFHTYVNVLQTVTSDKGLLKSKVNSLTLNDTEIGTSTNLALEEALRMVNSIPSNPEKTKVVILVSDGGINYRRCVDGPNCDVYRESGTPQETQLYCNSAAPVKAAVDKGFFGIYTNSQEEPVGLTQMRQCVAGADYQNVIDARQNVAKAFEDILSLIYACPCYYRTVTKVEYATNPGTAIPISTVGEVTTQSTINGETYPQEFPPPNAEVQFETETLPLTYQGKNNAVTLTDIPSGYEITERFCTENSTGVVGCPQGLTAQGQSIPGTQTDTINLNMLCGADITYGWRLAEACDFKIVAQIRDTNGNILPANTGFSSTATVVTADGQTKTSTEQFATDGKAQHTWNDSGQSKIQELMDAQSITVTLNPFSGSASMYEVVGTFCDDNAQGCPTNLTPPGSSPLTNLSLTGFDYFCEMDYTYGWVVNAIPTDAVCYNKTCDYVRDLQNRGVNTTNLTPCLESQVGTQPAACATQVCVGSGQTATCNDFAIENAPAGETCVVDEDCKDHYECTTDLTCELTDGSGRDECADDTDCYVYACDDATETCEEKGLSEIVEGRDIVCTDDDDCQIRLICHNMACVEDRSPGTDECRSDADCEETYLTCEGLQCVEKIGDKEDTCSGDEDCFQMVCTVYETCEPRQVTVDRPDECRTDADCQTPPPPPPPVATYKTCVEESCELMTGTPPVGTILCETDADCIAPEPRQYSYKTCFDESCVLVSGIPAEGTILCETDADCIGPEPKQYTYKTCVEESCDTLAGIPPEGTLICTSDADCIAPEEEQKTYKTCLEESCVVVTGTPSPGTQLCETDADCRQPAPVVVRPEPVPETGVDHAALVVSLVTMVILILGLRLIM